MLTTARNPHNGSHVGIALDAFNETVWQDDVIPELPFNGCNVTLIDLENVTSVDTEVVRKFELCQLEGTTGGTPPALPIQEDRSTPSSALSQSRGRTLI